jgi:uncharacterized membrane protein
VGIVLNDNLIRFFQENKWKILGGFLGLIVAVLFIIFGFWWGIFIIICILVGVFLGSLVENADSMQGFFDRLRRRQDRY